MAAVAEPETREEEVALELPPAGSVQAILAANDVTAQPVEVPEWRMTVKVRGFTRAEALEWSAIDGNVESDARLLQYGLVEPSVTEDEAREIVATKSQAAVKRIVVEVLRLSGLGATFPVEK